ncbi:DUF2971 domain-containing protein [Sphingomonas sp. SCN 67-18]|uniref:DUF2971 domain-containing protein n=1 Tax=uncultured Sphingomonas sp. TaxID=158754 RepID=UPI0025D6DCDA|nr:DUF2971 domain-containing protein [Sphingomonas sp. SCN 67-18]
MRLYHFVDLKWGLDDIRRRRLKIAKLNELNDPFEMLALKTNDVDLRRALAATKQQMAKSTGVLCFSRKWRNPVQWSHYADHHRGLCLGFDVPDGTTEAIRYSRYRILDDGTLTGGGDKAGELMQRLIVTKFAHWKYEDEVRRFMQIDERKRDDKIWYEPFSPTLVLKEVIVGPNSDLTRDDLRNALGSLVGDVEMRKARLAFRTFSVVEQRLASAWKNS